MAKWAMCVMKVPVIYRSRQEAVQVSVSLLGLRRVTEYFSCTTRDVAPLIPSHKLGLLSYACDSVQGHI